MVASLVTLYKKLKFVTDENVGWGPVDLPEIELQTTAYWLTAEGARDRLAARRAGRRADRRRAGDPGRRGGAADGRPAGPRARVAGPVAAPRGADDLPVRGDARRRRAVGAAVRAPRRAGRRRRGPDPRLPVRGGLSRRAPARGSSRTSTARRSRSACSRRSRAATARRARGGRMTAEPCGRRHPRAPAREPAGDARAAAGAPPAPTSCRRVRRSRADGARQLAARLAAALGADVADTPAAGSCAGSSRRSRMPIDRERLAHLPGPPARRTRRSCASTRRRPGSRRRPARSRSSSGSRAGRATRSARPSSSSPTTPTSRRCSPRSPAGSRPTRGS